MQKYDVAATAIITPWHASNSQHPWSHDSLSRNVSFDFNQQINKCYLGIAKHIHHLWYAAKHQHSLFPASRAALRERKLLVFVFIVQITRLWGQNVKFDISYIFFLGRWKDSNEIRIIFPIIDSAETYFESAFVVKPNHSNAESITKRESQHDSMACFCGDSCFSAKLCVSSLCCAGAKKFLS